MTQEQKIDEVIAKLRALQKLEKATKSRTTFAQNELLRRLDSETLAEVALILDRDGALNEPASK